MTKTTCCRACGQDFTYEYVGGRLRYYCGAICRARAWTMEPATCGECGKPCRKSAYKDRAVCGGCSAGRVKRTCANCGTEYEGPRTSNRRFCSMSCRRGMASIFTPRECVCGLCDQRFTADHPRQKWCTACITSKADRARARRYNISSNDLATLKAQHGGMCWICRKNKGQTVDHDHVTGVVRGYLCRGCNMALHFVERPDWWDRATAYLQGR